MATKTSLPNLIVVLTMMVGASRAYDFYVGGRDGWVQSPSENFNHWAERNRFQVNDNLVFKYKKGEDSVLVVNEADYKTCSTSNPIQRLDGGDSVFKFDRSGPFFFISGVPGRCQSGQKLIVVVLAVRPNRGASPPPASTPPALPTPSPPSTSLPSPSATPLPSPSASPAPPSTSLPSPSATPLPSPAASPSPPSTSLPSPSATPLPSPTSASPLPSPVATPSLSPSTAAPLTSPIGAPTPSSSATPVPSPIAAPTLSPSTAPLPSPSAAPSPAQLQPSPVPSPSLSPSKPAASPSLGPAAAGVPISSAPAEGPSSEVASTSRPSPSASSHMGAPFRTVAVALALCVGTFLS